MENYKIDEEKIGAIAKSFGTDENTVRKLSDLYKGLSTGIKYQYLAHVIRTIENSVGEILKNPLFQIKCVPVSPEGKILGFGSAQYFERNCYIIYYHPKMDEKQLRIVIAHELGHLVVETLLKNENPNRGISEPLSSIFGILTILDKNDFYQCRARNYQHPSWKQIIEDFLLLKNREKSILNSSSPLNNN